MSTPSKFAASLQDSPLFAPPSHVQRPKGSKDRRPRPIRFDAEISRAQISAFNAANPKHAEVWLAAMSAARDALPRCEAVTKKGLPCGTHQMKSSRFCRKHIPEEEFAERDRKERVRLQEFIIDRRSTPSIVERALRSVFAIEQRNLKRLWAAGQYNLPGETLFLSPSDSETVRRRLLADGIDIAFGGVSPRSVDKYRWHAFNFLRTRISERRYKLSLSKVTREEEQWRSAFSTE